MVHINFKNNLIFFGLNVLLRKGGAISDMISREDSAVQGHLFFPGNFPGNGFWPGNFPFPGKLKIREIRKL